METMMGYIEESAAQCRRNIEQASQLVQPAVDLYTKKEYNRMKLHIYIVLKPRKTRKNYFQKFALEKLEYYSVQHLKWVLV